MDLLQSILHNCDAEKYINAFKKHQINAYTLKALGDEDLKIIGVKEEEIRATILEHVVNLQIPSEKTIDRVINAEYIKQIINNMSTQLTKHIASILYIIKRNDIVICNVNTLPRGICLESQLESFEKTLDEFEDKLRKRRKPKSKKWIAALPAITLVTIIYVVYKNCK